MCLPHAPWCSHGARRNRTPLERLTPRSGVRSVTKRPVFRAPRASEKHRSRGSAGSAASSSMRARIAAPFVTRRSSSRGDLSRRAPTDLARRAQRISRRGRRARRGRRGYPGPPSENASARRRTRVAPAFRLCALRDLGERSPAFSARDLGGLCERPPPSVLTSSNASS